MIQPINGHLIVKPVKQESAWQSSQQTYEERGEVIAAPSFALFAKLFHFFKTFKESPYDLTPPGSFVFFDSWAAAKYIDGKGEEFWVIPFTKIRAIETND